MPLKQNLKRGGLLIGLVILWLLISISMSLAQGDTWVKKADMPTARVFASACEVDGIIYVIGGATAQTYPIAVSTVEAYNPQTNSWTTKTHMPSARLGLAVCAVNGKIYAIGGNPNGATPTSISVVEEYNPLTDAWTRKANMPTARTYFGIGVVDSIIYAIGGMLQAQARSVVEAYDPATNMWTKKTDMPTARNYLSASVVAGKIYVIGGAVVQSPALVVVEEYIPRIDTWTKKTDIPTARLGLGTSTANEMIYAIGGAGAFLVPGLAGVEEYDPETDTWRKVANMPTSRVWLTTCTAKGKIYAFGGTTDGDVSGIVGTVEVYEPPAKAPYIVYHSNILDDSQGNNNGRANAGETVKLSVTVRNIRFDATNATATLSSQDQDVQIIQGSINFGTIGRNQTASNQNNPFMFSVSSSCVAHRSTFYLDIFYEGGSARVASIDLAIGNANILLVDDDCGCPYESHYTAMMSKIDKYPDCWCVAEKGCPREVFQQYQSVIWFTGDDRETALSAEEQTAIAAFLDKGGRLLITGQNIGDDLVKKGSAIDSAFYTNYLHAKLVSDSTKPVMVLGVSGDPITNGLSASFIGSFGGAGNQKSSDIIAATSDAKIILKYTPGMGGAALCHENPVTKSRLVYLAFGLEGIAGPQENSAGRLLNNILTWLGGETEVIERDISDSNLPKGFLLDQNYPNPFNAQTMIEYKMPAAAHVTLEISNVLGQKIRTLVDSDHQAGRFKMVWDGKDSNGKNVPSGVYFYNLKAEGYSVSKKMLLVR